jgi:hypothetical protein
MGDLRRQGLNIAIFSYMNGTRSIKLFSTGGSDLFFGCEIARHLASTSPTAWLCHAGQDAIRERKASPS